MVGTAINLDSINNTSGDICRGITYQLRRAVNFKRVLDRFTSSDLITQFNMSAADANLMKSAFASLDTLNTTFQANRVFIDQLSGLGDV